MPHIIKDQSDIEHALVELQRLDPQIGTILEVAGDIPLRLSTPGLDGLAKIITSQLISKSAADTIWSRIKNHFGPLTPGEILESDEQLLKSLGLSGAKTRTIHAIASILNDAPNFLNNLENLDTKQAEKELTSIKGIGPWTAQVYLMFCLGHADIFPSGDIALRNIAGDLFYEKQRPNEKILRAFAARWQPFRSVAARVLWQYYAVQQNRDTNPI